MSQSAPTSRVLPFSIRLSPEERARLEQEAGDMSVASYIRWRLFEADTPKPKSRGKHPVKDHQALAQVLAMLGQSRMGRELAHIAQAADLGTLIMDEALQAELHSAAQSVTDMRNLLIAALGLFEDAP